MALMKSFVLTWVSDFNYCPLVWHICGGTDAGGVEIMQGRALRMVLGGYDLVAGHCFGGWCVGLTDCWD